MGTPTSMKAGIYSPYWETLGGGEYYAGSVASFLEKAGWQVELFTPNADTVKNLNRRFDLKLKSTRVNSTAQKVFNRSLIHKWWLTRSYDLFFFVSDGSVPFLFSRHNLLHFQVPFQNVGGRRFITRLKLASINRVICNSFFTKAVIDRHFGVDSMVIYPAVTPVKTQAKKEKLILSVGRFDGAKQGKRQDVLIRAFKQLKAKSYRLVLAGGALDKKCAYLTSLRRLARGLPVTFAVNCEYQALQEYYAQAAIYWHAHGYGTDIETHPEETEHFGISVVEAMSAGAIPVVFNGGGLTEIVDSKTGYTWNQPQQLVSDTKSALDRLKDQVFIASIRLKSHQFSKGVFDAKFQQIIG